VLTIILCEARAWEATWENFNVNILQALDSDLALCVSKQESNQNPFHKHAKFEWLIDEPRNWSEQYSTVAGNETWQTLLQVGDRLIGELDDELRPKLGSGAIQFYFRHSLRHQILSDGLLAKYDWFLVVRSDFLWLAPHPPLEILSRTGVTVLDGEDYGGICDRYALIPSTIMSEYLDIAEPIFFNPAQLKVDIDAAISSGQIDIANPEAFLKIRYIELGLWENLVRIPYFGFAVRLPGGATRGSEGKFSRELNCYVKYPDEYTASRVLATKVKTASDWISLLNGNRFLNLHRTSFKLKLFSVFLSQKIHRYLKKCGETIKSQVLNH
jgi:hypothetical protein